MEAIRGTKRKSPVDRTHCYFDIENLAQTGRLLGGDAEIVRDMLSLVVPRGDGDLVTLACDYSNRLAVRLAFPAAQIVWGYGRDGADLALITEIETDNRNGLSSRRITLGSGDHIFAPVLSQLAGMGAETTVVGIAGHTSSKLRLAAHKTISLPDLTNPQYEWSA